MRFTLGMSNPSEDARAWNREYASGRYQGELPISFVGDILKAAEASGLGDGPGLYIGCGNGRNYGPLVLGGLDLVGLDVSEVAVNQLARRMPERTGRLVCGDLSALSAEARHAIVIGIQVFQHGDRRGTHEHIRLAQARVAPKGLMCVRVNAAGTDVAFRHVIVEEGEDGGFTVRYLEGPKRGLDIHFFGKAELTTIFAGRFEPVGALRRLVQHRDDGTGSQWSQWEGIWRCFPE